MRIEFNELFPKAKRFQELYAKRDRNGMEAISLFRELYLGSQLCFQSQDPKQQQAIAQGAIRYTLKQHWYFWTLAWIFTPVEIDDSLADDLVKHLGVLKLNEKDRLTIGWIIRACSELSQDMTKDAFFVDSTFLAVLHGWNSELGDKLSESTEYALKLLFALYQKFGSKLPSKFVEPYFKMGLCDQNGEIKLADPKEPEMGEIQNQARCYWKNFNELEFNPLESFLKKEMRGMNPDITSLGNWVFIGSNNTKKSEIQRVLKQWNIHIEEIKIGKIEYFRLDCKACTKQVLELLSSQLNEIFQSESQYICEINENALCITFYDDLSPEVWINKDSGLKYSIEQYQDPDGHISRVLNLDLNWAKSLIKKVQKSLLSKDSSSDGPPPLISESMRLGRGEVSTKNPNPLFKMKTVRIKEEAQAGPLQTLLLPIFDKEVPDAIEVEISKGRLLLTSAKEKKAATKASLNSIGLKGATEKSTIGDHCLLCIEISLEELIEKLILTPLIDHFKEFTELVFLENGPKIRICFPDEQIQGLMDCTSVHPELGELATWTEDGMNQIALDAHRIASVFESIGTLLKVLRAGKYEF